MKKIFLIIFFFSKANAITIYDNEIDNFISKILYITATQENTVQNIKFSILLEDTPNAFIDENDTIFFTTGLLKYIEYPEALIGVVAHEIGHLNNFHIQKRKKSLSELSIIDQLGSITAVASSILAQDPELLIKSSIASKINIQNYYSSFSRNQEREADIFAIEKLNQLNISSNYLIKFLKFLKSEFLKKNIDKDTYKFSTHPNYEERLSIIFNLSNNNRGHIDEDTNSKYNFVRAKLFGYTETNPKILENYLNNEYLKYAKAILFSNEGNLLESLRLINELIELIPSNYHFIETKADILYAHSYTKEAKQFYKIALFNNSNNIYVKKRLFDIEYDSLNFDNTISVNEIFSNNRDLIYLHVNDIVFYRKWINILNKLQNIELMIFLLAKIDLINNDNKEASKKLQNLINTTNDKKLLKNSKILLNNINYE